MTERTAIPAAQYLRMSTEHQQYSPHNQADAISRYAAERGFQIVKTYFDPAKSGLLLKNRKGLKQLLQDVVGGQTEFRAVLVYDVSRWGRFQDHDESAHYEYLCRSTGVPLHYCAEPFNGHADAMAWILKSLKRTMAAEYSRELSVKVKIALVRMAKLGFKLGGSAPYGLRRQLFDAAGKPKQVLTYGERKNLTDEHVKLIPGPAEEVAVVNRIFREFADERRNPNSLAASLNQESIPFLRGAKWKANTIRVLLQDPHYIGMQVWGRTTAPLSTVVKRLPLEHWQVHPNAFQGIVSRELFVCAQEVFANLTIRLTDEQLLQRLKETLTAYGKLTSKIIDQSRLCPGATTYNRRFGGLLAAYARLGYDTPERLGQSTSRLRALVLRDSIVNNVVQAFPGQIEQVSRSKRYKPLLRYRRSGLLISVVIARCHPTPSGLSWRVHAPRSERDRTTVVALLDQNNSAIQSLKVFPNAPRMRVRLDNGTLCGTIQLEKITDLLEVLKQIRANVPNVTGETQSRIRKCSRKILQ